MQSYFFRNPISRGFVRSTPPPYIVSQCRDHMGRRVGQMVMKGGERDKLVKVVQIHARHYLDLHDKKQCCSWLAQIIIIQRWRAHWAPFAQRLRITAVANERGGSLHKRVRAVKGQTWGTLMTRGATLATQSQSLFEVRLGGFFWVKRNSEKWKNL